MCSIECKSVHYWNIKFEINFNFVLDMLKERSKWNIKSRIPKCFCNKMSKGTNKDWPNICQVPAIIPIFNTDFHVQKSRWTSFLHKREEPGNEVVICVASANYNRLWLIWKGLLFWGHPVCCHYVLYKKITIQRWRHRVTSLMTPALKCAVLKFP